MQSLGDTTNELRATNFSNAFRELTRHVLAEMAPAHEIRACSWFKQDNTARDGITRRHRAEFMIHGGLAPAYANDALGLDVVAGTTALSKAIEQLNKFVHVSEDTFGVPATAVESLAMAALPALEALLTKAAECRAKLCSQLASQMRVDILQAALAQTVQELDILASHHTIETVHVYVVGVTDVTASTIAFTACGNVDVELRWGSSSDQACGDGATSQQSFPFTCQFTSLVNSPRTPSIVPNSLQVDNSHWFGPDEGQ